MAFPGLQLSGVITSSPDKEGKDGAAFARLDTETGVAVTTDVDPQLTIVSGADAGLDVPMQSTLPPEVEATRRAD
jgi:hypothetical protein